MRAAWVALGVAVAAQGCAHFECTVHGGREARAITTEHFIVTSDLPPAKHEFVATRLELLWDTFAAFFHADVPHARIPVVMLDSEAAVSSFAEKYTGFVSRRGPTVLVVGGVGDEDGSGGSTAHELTHLVSAYMLPRQPRWLSEGLGTLFEDAQFHGDRRVRMGRWNAGRADRAFYEGVATLDELMQWGGLRFDESEARLYASAWAWVHYLSNHDEARLTRLFAELHGVKPMDQVMREVFPPDDAKRLHDEVVKYVGNARFRGWATDLGRTPSLSSPQPLAPWEVHALRSRLYIRDRDAARRELEQAVKLAPTPRPARVALIAARLEKTPVSQVLAAYPDDADVLVAAWDDDAEKADRARVTAALAKTPENVELLLLAAELAMRDSDATAASELVERGRTLAPWSVEFTDLAVQLALHQRECVTADLRLSELRTLVAEGMNQKLRAYLERTATKVAACTKQ